MFERDFEQRDSSEHEIRRRPTDRREVIKRIFYYTRISHGSFTRDFLNTNYTNHTNVERVEFVGIIHGQFMAIRDNKNFTIYCV